MSDVASLGRPRADAAPGAETTFPIRVGAADVGSNAIRFVIAEFERPRRHEVLDYVREPIRLGQGAFVSGRLDNDAMDAAVEAFRAFRGRLDAHGAYRIRAVATSAVRESQNGKEFARAVRDASDIELEVIGGAEEARLAWAAIRTRVDLEGHKWMMVDLGGGSVEVSLADDAGILWSESHTMGSVRLLEELAGSSREPGRLRELLAEYAATLRIPAAARHWNPVGLVATGGNIEALAELCGAEPDERGVSRVGVDELEAAADALARLSYRERVEDLGLREDRADVILPAALVYARVARLAGAETVHVPHVDVKDGVLLDLVDEAVDEHAHRDRGLRVLAEGCVALGRRHLFDEAHGRKVAELAEDLFRGLGDLHGLGPADLRILSAAALLHDVGQFIGYRKHHEHAHYILCHSELPGLTPHDTLLVALVARFHGRADPKEGHEGFTDLDGADRERVRRLAGLLRVADALDREHLQKVARLEVEVADGEVRLHPEAADGADDFLLERRALERKGELFEKAFERDLVLP